MKKTITTIAIIIIQISVNAQTLKDLYSNQYRVGLFEKRINAIYDPSKKDFNPTDSTLEKNLVLIKEDEIIHNDTVYTIDEMEKENYFHPTVKLNVTDVWFTCKSSSGRKFMINAVYYKNNIYYVAISGDEDNLEDIKERRFLHY